MIPKGLDVFVFFLNERKEGLTQKRRTIEQRTRKIEGNVTFAQVDPEKELEKTDEINRSVDSGRKGLTFVLLNLLY